MRGKRNCGKLYVELSKMASVVIEWIVGTVIQDSKLRFHASDGSKREQAHLAFSIGCVIH